MKENTLTEALNRLYDRYGMHIEVYLDELQKRQLSASKHETLTCADLLARL